MLRRMRCSRRPAARPSRATSVGGRVVVRRRSRRRHPPACSLQPAATACIRSITGGAEAWKVAAELAGRQCPVFVDPLQNLPAGFDQLGSRLDNAALLAKAGVRVAFALAGRHAQRAQDPPGRRQCGRQRPAVGRRAWRRLPACRPRRSASATSSAASPSGMHADLVLWDGDPLEVSTLAEVGLDARQRDADALAPDRTARSLPAGAGADAARVFELSATALARNRYYLRLPEPATARGSDPELAFRSDSPDGLAAELQQALRGGELFERWRARQEDPDAIDPRWARPTPTPRSAANNARWRST